VARTRRFPGRRVFEPDLPEKKSTASGSNEIIVNPLKLIYQSIIQLVKQAGALPRMIASASKQRQRQAVLNEREAERLDRICNPSKYRGK
jgi:hypothetical protein